MAFSSYKSISGFMHAKEIYRRKHLEGFAKAVEDVRTAECRSGGKRIIGCLVVNTCK